MSILAPLDAFQTRLLRSLGIAPEDPLLHFYLAPLSTRLDISILGVMRRALLGSGPACFSRFFRVDPSPPPPRERRAGARGTSLS
eukprot:2405353-Pyramimonas_sp.AAC.1